MTVVFLCSGFELRRQRQLTIYRLLMNSNRSLLKERSSSELYKGMTIRRWRFKLNSERYNGKHASTHYYLPVCLCIYLSVCRSVCLPACLHVSVYLSVCL